MSIADKNIILLKINENENAQPFYLDYTTCNVDLKPVTFFDKLDKNLNLKCVTNSIEFGKKGRYRKSLILFLDFFGKLHYNVFKHSTEFITISPYVSDLYITDIISFDSIKNKFLYQHVTVYALDINGSLWKFTLNTNNILSCIKISNICSEIGDNSLFFEKIIKYDNKLYLISNGILYEMDHATNELKQISPTNIQVINFGKSCGCWFFLDINHNIYANNKIIFTDIVEICHCKAIGDEEYYLINKDGTVESYNIKYYIDSYENYNHENNLYFDIPGEYITNIYNLSGNIECYVTAFGNVYISDYDPKIYDLPALFSDIKQVTYDNLPVTISCSKKPNIKSVNSEEFTK